VVRFKPQTLRTLQPLQDVGPSRYQMGYRRCGAENMPFPCQELNPYSPVIQPLAYTLVTRTILHPVTFSKVFSLLAKTNVFLSWTGIAQSESLVPGGGEIFRTRPDRSWGPSIVLYNGCRVFPRGKAAGRGVDHPLPYSTEVKESVELHIYSTYEP